MIRLAIVLERLVALARYLEPRHRAELASRLRWAAIHLEQS